MSKLIDTDFGQFRQVTDGTINWFLLQCPDCGEMLPIDDEMFAGEKPINHESKKFPASFCTFSGTKALGPELISKMQTDVLFGRVPYHDEGQTHAKIPNF
jgi:hypothetical protein